MFRKILFFLVQAALLNFQTSFLVFEFVFCLRQFCGGGSFGRLKRKFCFNCQSFEFGQAFDVLKLDERIQFLLGTFESEFGAFDHLFRLTQLFVRAYPAFDEGAHVFSVATIFVDGRLSFRYRAFNF